VRRYLPSVAGRDLILTIDRNVQWIAEEELARALELYKAQGRHHHRHGAEDGRSAGDGECADLRPQCFHRI
jgi:hypothetical protein